MLPVGAMPFRGPLNPSARPTTHEPLHGLDVSASAYGMKKESPSASMAPVMPYDLPCDAGAGCGGVRHLRCAIQRQIQDNGCATQILNG